MNKKTILHFTYTLERGGAEVMLVRVLKELKEYKNVVVELYGNNAFGNEMECDEYISMNIRSVFSLPGAIIRLRKIIRSRKVDIVHTHLFWPTIIARLATPCNVTLITTIHTTVSSALDYKKWYVRFIDRYTCRFRKSTIIAVSEGALKDYLSFLKKKPYKFFLLHTFADTDLFAPVIKMRPNTKNKFLLVSIGALRPGKNFEYLITALAGMKGVELHIYGEGCQRNKLEKLIEEYKAPVVLKGEVSSVQHVLPLYDLYVSASSFEGFSLAVLEAMSMKIPLLLSDIPSYLEQCGDSANYFGLKEVEDFKLKLDHCINNRSDLEARAINAHKRVLENFTLNNHTAGLRKIYTESLAEVS